MCLCAFCICHQHFKTCIGHSCVFVPLGGGVPGFGYTHRTYLRGAISHSDPLLFRRIARPRRSTVSARRRACCPRAAGYVARTPRRALSAPQSTLSARRAIHRLHPTETRLVAASKITQVQSADSNQTRNPTKLNPNCLRWAELVYASGPGRSPPRESRVVPPDLGAGGGHSLGRRCSSQRRRLIPARRPFGRRPNPHI